METNPAVKYLGSLSHDELQQIAEDLQKPTLEENSPLRKAAKEIFGEDNMVNRIGVAVPLCGILAGKLDTAMDALSTYR